MIRTLLLDGALADGNDASWVLLLVIIIAVPTSLLVVLVRVVWRLSKPGESTRFDKVVLGLVVLLLALIGGCLSWH